MRSVQQVVHEFQVQEEVEGVRQEVREVKWESKVEERERERVTHFMDEMNDKDKTHDLSHGAGARRCDTVLKNKKKRDNARSRSDNVEVSGNGHVVIGVRIVPCYHAIMDVVIGVRVMQCYHAIMSNSAFSTILNFPLLVPILNLLSGCINSSSLFPVAFYCRLLYRENMSLEVLYLHPRRLK